MNTYTFTGRSHERLNYIDETVKFPLKIIWKSKIKKDVLKMGNPVFTSSNIIFTIPVHISIGKPSIVNLDLESGRLVWELSIEESEYIQPYICTYEDMIYAGSPLVGIRISDADVIWKSDLIVGEGILTYKDRLYINHVNGIEAREPQTGRILWSGSFKSATSPSIYDEKLVFGDGPKGNIYCVHSATGELIWKKNIAKIGEYLDETHSRATGKDVVKSGWLTSAFPIISNGLIYCSLGRYMCCFDLETGNLIWKSIGAGTPIYKDGKLYSYRGYDFFCYQADTGETLYRKHYDEEGSYSNSLPFIAGNALFVGTKKGLYAIDINNGDKIWEFHSKRKNSECLSQPVFINGKLYAGCSDGCLYCFAGNS